MMRFFRWIVLVVSFSSVVACSGSDSPPTALFDGSRPSLSNFYSESQLVMTESLGFALNFGDSPPEVGGIFRLDPIVFQASSIPDDPLGVGNTDIPLNIVFSDQDTGLLTLDVSIGPDIGEKLIEITNAVISGSGNAFTVFALAVLPEANGLKTRMAFSGNLTEFGIENFQFAPFLVGGEDDENDDVRLFVDQDNLSERLEELPTAVITDLIKEFR